MQRYILEAVFADGFKYLGNNADVSVVDPKRNVFFDIKEGLHAQHGKLVKYTVHALFKNAEGNYGRHDIDFSKLPDNAKPIWFIKREADFEFDESNGKIGKQLAPTRDILYGFGYEFTDEKGELQKEIIELT
jgi:hypothetical protein